MIKLPADASVPTGARRTGTLLRCAYVVRLLRGTLFAAVPRSTAPDSLPAIAAITGAFITMGVAASGAAAFHHAMVQDASTDTPGADHIAVRMASVHDGARQVYTEITISAAAGRLSLGGDISPVMLYNETYIIPGGDLLPAGSINTVSYSGLLETTDPVSAGDILVMVLRHPAGEDVVTVRVR